MFNARDSRILQTIILLILVFFISFPAYAKYGGGTGEPDSPYLINTPQHMNAIGANRNDWGKHFKLMADIDLAGFTGTQFNVIGFLNLDDSKPFTGVFDGNNHTISNFSYTSETTDFIGLFGYVKGADSEIKNLTLIDPNVDAGIGIGAGSLVGSIDFGTITNCQVVNGNVSGWSWVGGIAGQTFLSIITDCHVEAVVSGWDEIGGLIGESYSGVVVSCSAVSDIIGIGKVGGLVGVNEFFLEFGLFVPGVIVGCYSEGEVEGFLCAGGLVGDNFAVVTDSYSKANVNAGNRVGGLVGHNYLMEDVFIPPEISNCYSVGSVTGNENTGGLVGANEGGIVSHSFWDKQTSGLSNSGGGAGKSTSQMQSRSTFTNAGWDFTDETSNGEDDIWWIQEGQDYPRLFWELAKDEPNEPNEPGEPDEPDGVVDPMSEALDTNLIFTTGGDEGWISQTETYYYDSDAAQSGDITNEQTSWIQTTVSGAGTVSFYWKVSSEGNCDYLEFYIDDARQEGISGSKDWHQMTFEITGSGEHTLEWRYSKDESISRGDDCGWVDEVEWVPTP